MKNFWEKYKTFLNQKFKNNEVTLYLDKYLEEIKGFLKNKKYCPNERKIGMVYGQVQAGKTGNYIGLICKIADEADHLIISVLTGTTEILRTQTQERLEEGFVGRNTGDQGKPYGVGHLGGGR